MEDGVVFISKSHPILTAVHYHKSVNKGRNWIIIGVGLTTTLVLGYAQMRSYPASSSNTELSSPEAQTFLEIYQLLQDEYLKPVDNAKLWRGAVEGMLQSLDDPFTGYDTPEASVADAEDLSGQFFGIGVQLRPTNPDGTGATADVVYKGQSAAEAGVQPEDHIVKVNGVDVTKLKLKDVVRKIRGPEGSTVKIEFVRDSGTVEYTMTRKPVELKAVETAMISPKVGYISLNTFYNEKVFDQMSNAIASMKKNNVQKIILDLRDNGGGLLCAGTYVADLFLQEGSIVTLRDRKGNEKAYGSPLGGTCSGKAHKSATDYTGQLVVLVNKNSASASEIVSGALQDSGRAKIIGEKTFGKGVAQEVINTKDGGTLRLVAEEWLTPKGRSIHGKGLDPDIVVEDDRFGKPLNVEGMGATAGQKVTITIGDKTVEATADKDGKFIYTAPRKKLKQSSVQGEAAFDIKNDAQLRKALDTLGEKY